MPRKLLIVRNPGLRSRAFRILFHHRSGDGVGQRTAALRAQDASFKDSC
jgi:hypothetical protein